jgi:hypothetical protein
VLEKRADVIAGLNAARDGLAKNDGKAALSALAPLGSSDPVGGALALFVARASLAGGDAEAALRAASRAVTAGRGRADLVAQAGSVVAAAREKLSRPKSAAQDGASALAPVSAELHADVIDQACPAIEAAVRAGKVDLPSLGATDIAEFTCATDMTLDVGVPALRRAYALRADVSGAQGSDRLLWVALEGAKGRSLYGPVASVFGRNVPGALNDVVLDLQKIDVLQGGAPEVVVKIIERRTLPDVALNEIAELDEIRAIILTTDRGGVVASREVVLSSRASRVRIDPASKRIPRGFSPAAEGAHVEDYSMKVTWGGPNSMTLTKVSGNAKPLIEGEIQLFP